MKEFKGGYVYLKEKENVLSLQCNKSKNCFQEMGS